MGKVRYLGSKARLVEYIEEVLGTPNRNERFVDLFSGTGIVSKTIAKNGWSVVANDFLQAASIMTTATLISASEVSFKMLGGYDNAIKSLNSLKGKEGFFYREYSPSKQNLEGVSRPYFSEENAKKIDAIRSKIKSWNKAELISELEKKLLLADLIGSSNQVANIAGTYGCFLKSLTKEALKPITLSARPLNRKKVKWQAYSCDAFQIKVKPNDVVYLDPPYTKRQYAAYYHIPETLACEDEPIVAGITGLRPWETKASPFCYKTKATQALQDLISGMDSKRIIISYSSDGHICFDNLMAIANEYGKVSVKKIRNFERYSPNSISRINSSRSMLTEYIIDITR